MSPTSSLRPSPGSTTPKLPPASSFMPEVRPDSGPMMPRSDQERDQTDRAARRLRRQRHFAASVARLLGDRRFASSAVVLLERLRRSRLVHVVERYRPRLKIRLILLRRLAIRPAHEHCGAAVLESPQRFLRFARHISDRAALPRNPSSCRRIISSTGLPWIVAFLDVSVRHREQRAARVRNSLTAMRGLGRLRRGRNRARCSMQRSLTPERLSDDGGF